MTPRPSDRSKRAGDRVLFLFDGECGFCRKWAGWLQRRAGTAVRFVPFQQRNDLREHGLTVTDLQAASYLIEEGRPYGAGRGFARTMTYGRGVWKVIGWGLDLPIVRLVTDAVYRWVARNRHRLPAPDRDVSA